MHFSIPRSCLSICLSVCSYLDSWVTLVATEECADMFIIILGGADVMVLFECRRHFFATCSILGQSSSDPTKTSFTAFNLNQLFDIQLLVRSLVPSLCLAVLQLTLHKQG